MSKKVLVVEDFEDSRNFMKILLEISGYSVYVATNGFEAVEKVENDPPDLILMDIAMPIMDGLTATLQIRKKFDARKLPIIAVSGQGSSYYERAIAAGCNEMIDKPVDFERLEPVIKQYLQAH